MTMIFKNPFTPSKAHDLQELLTQEAQRWAALRRHMFWHRTRTAIGVSAFWIIGFVGTFGVINLLFGDLLRGLLHHAH